MKPLKRIKNILYHYNINGVKTDGPHSKLSGDYSELRGDCSGLIGDLDKITERPAYISDFVEA